MRELSPSPIGRTMSGERHRGSHDDQIHNLLKNRFTHPTRSQQRPLYRYPAGEGKGVTKEEFIAIHGHRYSRCVDILEAHEGHQWTVEATHGYRKLDIPCWCDGSELKVKAQMEEQNKPTTEVAKWADKAMFEAEPLDASAGPKVYLLWMTPDPLGAIAAACKMYKGEVVRNLRNVNDRERLEYLEQIQKTKLKAPFEFVKFHFLIEGVTRSFTHQLVRQRTAVYAQESLRFAVKSDMPVGLPPSLAGTWDGTEPNESGMTHEDQMRAVWDKTLEKVSDAYGTLVDMGMPAEDARGLLPHNVLTRVHYSTDLRALLDHAGNRLCTQAQFEWRLVFAQIAKAIRDADTRNLYPQKRRNQSVPDDAGLSHAYMSQELADLFKPVCYQTGKCEFKANFDRACKIRERVDANESIGRPSSEWGNRVDLGMPNPVMDPHNPAHKFPWADTEMRNTIIPEIKPGEWLLDPGAARER